RRERLLNDSVELRWNTQHEMARRFHVSRTYRLQQSASLEIAVQRTTGQKLMENNTKRVDVGATIDLLSASLLRRHVAGLALEHADLLTEEVRARDTKVCDFYGAVGTQEDVLG